MVVLLEEPHPWGGVRRELPDPVRQIVVTAVRLPRLASFGRLTQPNPNGGTEWRALIDVDAAEEHESGYSFRRGFCGMLPRHHGRGIAADHGQALVRHVADRRAREDVGGPGSGVTCDGCDAPILPSESEHEVEMPDGRTLRFHIACRGLWQVLQKAMPPRT